MNVLIRHASDGNGKIEMVSQGNREVRSIDSWYMGNTTRIRDHCGEDWAVKPNADGAKAKGSATAPEYVTIS